MISNQWFKRRQFSSIGQNCTKLPIIKCKVNVELERVKKFMTTTTQQTQSLSVTKNASDETN